MHGVRRSRRRARPLQQIGEPANGPARNGEGMPGVPFLPPIWAAVLTRLGSGAALPAGEIEPWARAVTLAELLVRQIDAGLGRGRPTAETGIGGVVAGAIAPAVLAWLAPGSGAETTGEATRWVV